MVTERMNTNNNPAPEMSEFIQRMKEMQSLTPRDILSKIETEEQAKQAAQVLRKLVSDIPVKTLGGFTQIGRVLSKLSVNLNSPAMKHVVEYCLPAVREMIVAAVESPECFPSDDVFRALGILIWCRQVEDVCLISGLISQSFRLNDSDWSRVFGRLDPRHPLTLLFLEGFEAKLPGGVIDEMLLKVANSASEFGVCERHIFDTEEGCERLRIFLNDHSDQRVEPAWQAAKAIRWMRSEFRPGLLLLAGQHLGVDVRVELAGTKAALGDEAGYAQLIEFCLNPVFSELAQDSLRRVGAAERIPRRCVEPDFVAMSDMSRWLSFPSEFGRPPNEISMLDLRKLFWPPADEFCNISLVRYVYTDVEPTDIGIGCTGNRTFAIFGVPTAELSIVELLALYCAHEGMDNVELGDEQGVRIAINAGLEWLKQKNPGMFD